ncbi:MAG: PAS domain S-box protein [Sedimentisphaerales bacterium]
MKKTQLFNMVSEILSICIFLGGAIVLIGWVLDIPVLKSISPDFVAMKANAAICFILIGLSLWMSQTKWQGNRTVLGIARLYAFIVFLIGFLTFWEYMLGWDFGIDQLLFKESATAVLTSAPGRMAFNTSVIFVIIAIALFMTGFETAFFPWLAQLLVIPAGIISLLSFVGYLYGASPLYIGLKFSTAMAVHTCVLFLMSCIGCLFVKPRRGLMKNISSDNYGGMMLRRILPVVIVIPLVLGWFKIYGVKTGLLGNEFGVSFVAICNLFIISLFVYILSVHLNRLDAKRKQTEKVLRDSEVRYKTLFSTAVEGILVADVQKKQFLHCNPAICRMLGYTEEELIHLNVGDIHPKEALDHVLAEFEALVRGKKKFTEVPCLCKDGTIFDASISASGIVIDGRECSLGFFTDITERKRAEEAVKESEEKYRTLVENASDQIFMVDEKYKIVSLNSAALMLLGRKAEEVIGKHISELFPKEIADKNLKNLKEIFKTGKSISVEEELIFKGNKIFVSSNLNPVKNDAGKVIGVLGVIRDITERKQAGETIREKGEIYHALFEQANDAIFLMEKEYFVDCNERTLEMFGVTREQIINQPPIRFSPEFQADGRRSAEKAMEKIHAAYTGEPQCFEWTHTRLDGTPFDAEVSLGLIKIGGRPLLQAIVRDITARKRAEEKAKNLNEKLKDTNQEMKDFLYATSHDLREPLRKVSTFAYMLEKSLSGKIGQDDSENLRFMMDGSNKMTKMIEGLLTYSSVITNNLPPETVKLDDLIDKLKNTELADLITGSGAIIDIPKPLLPVEADYSFMRQLLHNLIVNGIKYQKNGNIPYITITSKPAANGMAKIEITDNGIGIAPEYHQAIFTMFKRLHLRNEYDGIGIGLTISKKIVEHHGGEIGVESQPDKGSTFWFTMPAAKTVMADANAIQASI